MKTSRLKIGILFVMVLLLGYIYYDASVNEEQTKLVALNPRILSSNNVKTSSVKTKENDSNKEFDSSTAEITETDISAENKETQIIPEETIEPIVYDGLTLNQLGEKIERNLSSTLVGKGQTFANYAIELGVDPYIGLAIVLHETGCSYGCSYLTNACNNIGGQKGSGCGAYAYFDSLDAGIYAFLSNLSNNYFSYGLNTPELIGPKYAEDPEWSYKVGKYIEKIKNN
ncbi:MAG: glucosaminidase domain-containing protein [Bacilli bacterium]